MLRFEIHDAEGAQRYYWRVVNGTDNLARSETMYNKADAISAAQKVKQYAGTARITFEAFARDGRWYWHAQAGNGEIMLQSTNYYWTERTAQADADFVERNAVTAEIVDMTRTASRW